MARTWGIFAGLVCLGLVNSSHLSYPQNFPRQKLSFAQAGKDQIKKNFPTPPIAQKTLRI